MPQQLQVRDVMTRKVISATTSTPLAEIARLFATHHISAVPIIDDHDRMLGVVSEADLLSKIAADGPAGRASRRRTGAAKATATLARDVMSTTLVTIAGHAPLAAAAKKMQAENVKRLLVTGETGHLLGVVSRTDVIRPFTRPDEAIRHDVIDGVLRRRLWIDPSQVSVHVDAGVATLTGAIGRRTTAAIAARLTATVPGVIAVVNRIRYDFDDTDLARSRVNTTHPFSAEPFRP
jgi:CBS domain-containing protein